VSTDNNSDGNYAKIIKVKTNSLSRFSLEKKRHGSSHGSSPTCGHSGSGNRRKVLSVRPLDD